MTLEIVDKIRLLTFCLIFFDLSIISAHTPTSTAFKKMRVLISFWWSFADALGAAITSAEIASIFSFLAFYESLTTFDNPISKTRDLASTFLDPAGSGPIIASGLIGLRTGDVSVLLPSLFFLGHMNSWSWLPILISSKKPFGTSLQSHPLRVQQFF